ncbi:DUF5640 domain-containing protein [Tenacibaculum xiamenense]|uniref:DUF5640 domain-containing protein n=1 Tax=Tenacibaculum xiamenense TaxID=1261553 RepID=UPI00389465D2
MRNLKRLLILLVIMTNIKCSNNEELTGTSRTNKELLSSKEWKFDKFIFISSDYNPGNFSTEKIEEYVNSLYLNKIVYKFNSDNSGYLLFNTENRIFTWQLNNNELKLDFENNDYDTDYLLNSIDENTLNMTFDHSSTGIIDGVETTFKGNYFYK